MANMNAGTTHAVFIPEVWSDGTLDAAQFAEVFAKRVTREFEGAISKMGDTVHIGRISNLSTSDKADDTDVTFQAITETEDTLTITNKKYAAFLVEDVLAVQSNIDLRQKYERKIGYALTRAREVTLAGLVSSLPAAQEVGTLGVEMTSDDYLAVWQKLAEAGLVEDSPDVGGEFSLILSPAAYAAALKVSEFTNRQVNPQADAIGRAHVGDIYSMPVFLSNLLNAPATGQHRCVAMHRGCFALAVQKEVTIKSDYLIEKLGDAVVGWTMYGSALLDYPPEDPGGGVAVANRGVELLTV